MPLPVNHPWAENAPAYSEDYFLYADIGASNAIGGGSALNDPLYEEQSINLNFSKVYKHNGSIEGAATPINGQTVSTYDLLDEAGRYNRNNRLLERIRERHKKKVCVVQGGASARPLNDINNGWISDIVNNQVVSLIKAAESACSTKIRFLMLNVLGRDTRFNADPSAILQKLEEYCEDIRTDLGNSSLPIFIIGLGVNPPTLTTDNPVTYPNWENIRTTCATINQANTYWIEMGDADYATYIHDKGFDGTTPDEVHWNAKGQNLIADRVFNRAVSEGVI